MSEAEILKQCLEFLSYLPGVVAWRCNSGAVVGEHNGKRRFVKFSSAKGLSDIIGVIRMACGARTIGRFLAVECKAEKGKLTPDQANFLASIELIGGLALCVRSVDELDQGLRREGVIA